MLNDSRWFPLFRKRCCGKKLWKTLRKRDHSCDKLCSRLQCWLSCWQRNKVSILPLERSCQRKYWMLFLWVNSIHGASQKGKWTSLCTLCPRHFKILNIVPMLYDIYIKDHFWPRIELYQREKIDCQSQYDFHGITYLVLQKVVW